MSSYRGALAARLPARDDRVRTTRTQERALLSVAALFIGINWVALWLVEPDLFRYVAVPAGWALLFVGAHLLLARYRPVHDPLLLPIIALLTGLGLLLIARLAVNFLPRQLGWLALSLAVMLLLAIVPRSLLWLRRFRYTWLLFGLVLLAATFFFGVNPIGLVGPTQWLPNPLFERVFFQPSELLKLLLVIFLASYFDDWQGVSTLTRGRFTPLIFLLPLLLMWGFSVLLLVWQRDLGAATLFFLLFLALMYIATGRRRYIMGGLLLLMVGAAIGYQRFGVVSIRIDAWWNPWLDFDNTSFQIVQSLYAIASGGVIGTGIGQGFPDFIPVVHSDFIFAAVAEEFGLAGSVAVIGCYVVLAHRGMKIALQMTRPFHVYLAIGIVVAFSAQALLIMGGVVKLLPLTGVTLPFVSYGGSSLLVSSVMVGLLLFMSAKTAVPEPWAGLSETGDLE